MDNQYPHFIFDITYIKSRCGLISPIFDGINFKRLNVIDALKLSIEKWDFVSHLIERENINSVNDGGISSCALCQKYYGLNRYTNHCINCPIYKDTKVKFCSDTPYHKYINIENDKEALLVQAKAEAEYLHGLLEKLQKGE